MTCITKSSIKEILHGLNIKDPTCVKKVLKFNRMLRMFYTDTYMFRQNLISESITVTDGTATHTTEFPIYKVWGFFGTGSGPCFEKIDSVCECCGDGKSYIRMQHNSFDEGKGRYKILGEKDIKYTIPCDASNVHVVYSRGPQYVTSICDTIEIDGFMLTGLELLIEWFYERNESNQNRQQLIQSDYYKWLVEAKKVQEERIDYIGK